MTNLKQALYECTEGNFQNAVRILEPLAEQGDVMAQLKLGVLYREGREGMQDLLQNFEKAFIYLEKAAEQEDPDAQYYLGMMYYKGEGCTPNLEKAMKYFKLAEKQGNAGAIQALDDIKKSK